MTEQEWLDIFSENLRECMIEKGYTQKELAEETGLSEAAISNYVNGRKFPSVRAIINMSYALRVSLIDFIDFGDFIN